MELLLKYFIVCILQLSYNLLRIHEIKLTYENKLKQVLINTILMNLVILASTYYSLSMLLSGDWFVGVVYVVGAVLGKWIGLTRSTNYRKKVLEELDEIKHKE
jgi:amino acid transporter